ncbi:ferrochelatase [Psychrosphaera haliotis]|uniref:Ferrochelatase n=1 Tax=Psychrosphaera haliotis TaxID=555083 RepID=A0A6N8F821_9GAMM|nr:ferrochelatase [Psychrosphaera haliotis]MUH72324.1 ferrochelatase [Psychrosphaera haliotis]
MKFQNTPNFSHGQQDKIGVLLTNLGTPDAPTKEALKPYLKEFLSDPRVVEIPRLIWWCILNGVILPFRSRRSAKAYKGVWTEEGSPLLVNTQNIANKVAEHYSDKSDVIVDFAMRYGNPSVESKLQGLLNQGARKVIVLPLYPQYSATTTASTFDAVADVFKKTRFIPELRFVNHYTDSKKLIIALANKIRKSWEANGKADKLIFSYHGIPNRYWHNGDPYACQCHKTSRLLAEELGLGEGEYLTCFQSRFGKEEWVKPYLDHTLKALPSEGIKSVQVVCPGFSADCLETIEEIGEENRDYFLEAGGAKFEYISCLNDEAEHIDALSEIIDKQMLGWNVEADVEMRDKRAEALRQSK